MQLARRKDGSIGRMIPGQGEEAKVANISLADRRGDTYLSQAVIDENDKFLKRLELKKQAEKKAKELTKAKKDQSEKISQAKMQAQIAEQQVAAQHDPLNEALKKHFALAARTSETVSTVKTLRADFSDRTEVVDDKPKRPMVARADYRQNQIVGNPLTRDGKFGPYSDYEKIVNGTENEPVSYAGGTMLKPIYPGDFGNEWMESSGNQQRHSQMGEFSWDTLWSDTVDAFTDQAPGALADAATKVVVGAITPQKPAPAPATTVINKYVPTQVASGVNSMANSMGVPPAVIYGTMGLFGIAVMAIVYKAVAGK
jgi:hypothetical protein